MKDKYIVISITILILLTIIYIFYNINILNNYSSSFFEVDFDKEWKQLTSNNQKIVLQNNNNSTIQIISKTNKNINFEKEKEDIYFDLEEEFQNDNKDYNLININNTEVGTYYKKAKEYLYEHNGYQTLLIIIIENPNIIEITYTAKDQFFDFDLKEFYNVSNTLKISGEKNEKKS